MEHWSTVFDIVQYGIEGDKEKCRAYAELLRDILLKDGDVRRSQYLQKVLDGQRGQKIHLAEDDSTQVGSECMQDIDVKFPPKSSREVIMEVTRMGRVTPTINLDE